MSCLQGPLCFPGPAAGPVASPEGGRRPTGPDGEGEHARDRSEDAGLATHREQGCAAAHRPVWGGPHRAVPTLTSAPPARRAQGKESARMLIGRCTPRAHVARWLRKQVEHGKGDCVLQVTSGTAT